MDNEIDEDHYRSPFYLACKNEDIELVKEMLEDTTIDVNWQVFSCDMTGFMRACYKPKPNIELISCLMNNNRINYNLRGINGFTGFDMLICDPNNIYNKHKISEHKMTIIKELMEDPRIDISEGFESACFNGDIELIELLLNNNRVDPNIRNNYNNRTIFYKLCVYDTHYETVKYLLNWSNIDVNMPDNNGITPLMIACFNQNINIVKLLVNSDRININHHDEVIKNVFVNDNFNVFKKLVSLYGINIIHQLLS